MRNIDLRTAASTSRRGLTRAALTILLGLAGLTGRAQILDDIEMRPQAAGAPGTVSALPGAALPGAAVEVVVHFAAQVSYRRYVVSPTGDEVQVYFVVTAAGDSSSRADDVRDLPAGLGLPRLSVRLPARGQSPTLRRMDLRFDTPVQFLRVGPGPDNRTLVAVVRGAMPIEVAPPASATAAPGGGARAHDPQALLAEARTAMAAEQYEAAVAALNRVLDLPPNAASQAAQELVGDARAALGETARARAEYQLYLKLYPDSPQAEGVRARLAALDAQPTGRPGRDTARASRPSETTAWGSVSQYYYGGQSQIRNETTIVTPATDATEIDVQNISSNDQSSIVTNLDANARYRGDGWDNRFVVRDVHVLSLIDAQPTQNRLSALYADFRNESMGFDARIGRQSSTSGGVLGRFDGGMFHYAIGGDWRIGALGGRPVEEGLGKAKYFYGATLDNDHLLPGLGFGLFAIEQRTEGYVDRRAVGAEVRYFDEHVNAFSLLDYDVRHGRLNIGSLQGTWLMEGGGTVNLLYDYRRSPTLQLTNALLGTPVSSIDRLRELESKKQIEDDALGLTPTSKVLLLSGTYPITQRWQLGTEARVSSISGTHATDAMPAAAGSGNVYSYTLQAIGTGVGNPNSVLVFSGSRLTSEASDAWLGSMNARYRPSTNWSIEPSLRYYTQEASNATKLRRLSPTLRITWQVRESIALESEISYERSHTTGALTDETSDVFFYYLGYHWDF